MAEKTIALAYYSQQGTYHTGFVTDAGWVAAFLLIAAAALQLRHRTAGPFLYWCFAVLVVLVFGRQLLTVLDNQRLNRQLAAMIGQLEGQAFHDRVEQALARRLRQPTPMVLLFIGRQRRARPCRR